MNPDVSDHTTRVGFLANILGTSKAEILEKYFGFNFTESKSQKTIIKKKLLQKKITLKK